MTTTRTPRLSLYTIGFILSLTATIASFWIAAHFTSLAPVAITLLAISQLYIQVAFFLHLGGERFSTHMLWFTGIVIGILIVGTLWIMVNLSRLHPHSPTTTDLYEHGIVAPQNELK